MQQYKDIIDMFFGGVSEDPRIQKKELYGLSSHFDTSLFPKKLVPYRAMEADENTAYKIVNFLFANSRLYGLGVVSASAKVALYYKSTPGSVITDSWSAPANNEDSAGTRATEPFSYYHGYIFGLSQANRIWAYGDITGSPSFTATALSISYTNTCKGLVTSDDLFLQPYDNKIAVKDGIGAGPTANWETARLTLPSYFTISDVCENGELAYVGAKTGDPSIASRVFIWDKISADPLDSIDWGEGDLILLDWIDGELYGVSVIGGNSSLAIKARLAIRKWVGGKKAITVYELQSDDTTLTVYGNHTKCKVTAGFLFGIKIKFGGTTYHQMASLGRKSEGYPVVFSFDRLINNDTALTGAINGAFKLGSYLYAAFNDDGSVKRTNDAAVYTSATATYVTQKLDGTRQVADAKRRDKQIVMAGLMFTALTSGQSIKLYYRVNGGSFVLIRTYSTVGGTYFEAGQADTNGDGVPDADFLVFKEVEFKVECIGGAELLAIPYTFNLAGADVSSE